MGLQKNGEDNCAHICFEKMKYYLSIDYFKEPKFNCRY